MKTYKFLTTIFTVFLFGILISCVEKTPSKGTTPKVPAKAVTVKNQQQKKSNSNNNSNKKDKYARINVINNKGIAKTKQPIPIKEESLTISGWARGGKSLAKEVYVTVDGESFRAKYGLDSPQLAEVLKSNVFSKAGFAINIPKAKIGSGLKTVGLKISFQDGQTYISNHRVKVNLN